jgi:autotransporter-associated beta strand protein
MKFPGIRCHPPATLILVGSIALLLACRKADAQTAEGYTGGNYLQNFSGLPIPFSSNAYSDFTAANSGTINGVSFTLPAGGSGTPFDLFSNALPASVPGTAGMTGWYAVNPATGSGMNDFYAANGGKTSTGGIYTFYSASGGSITNEALGMVSTSSSGAGEVGLLLQNNTGGTLDQITLSYSAEWWRQSTTAKSLNFGYEVESSPAALPTSGLTPISLLNSGSFATGTATGADQAQPYNTIAVNPGALSISNWTAGSYLWLTWTMSSSAGSGQGIGIANLSFSASETPPDVWNKGSGTWDTSSANWTGSGSGKYTNGDNVVFNNQAGTGGTITIVSSPSISPGNVTVSAATGTYFFTGGALGGVGALLKSGGGALDLTGQTSGNGFTGGVTLSGGTLVISADNQLGGANGALSIDNAILSITSSIPGMNRWAWTAEQSRPMETTSRTPGPRPSMAR